MDLAFQKALARPVKPREQKSLLEFLTAQREHYGADKDEAVKLMHVGIFPISGGTSPTELAAWTQVCRVILNLQETITRY